MGYLSIPVLAKFYLNKTLSLELGPQASFLLSERKNVDFKDAKTFEFGCWRVRFKITKNFFLQGRYELGLTEASKDAEIKNSLFKFQLVFKF